MKLFVLISVLLTLVCCGLSAETGFLATGDNAGKVIMQPDVAPQYTPPVIIDRNEAKVIDPNGVPQDPIQPLQTGGTALKEANPKPVLMDYHPVIIDRNEPKEANPVYLPVENAPAFINKSEPKEDVIGTGSGQTRVDPDIYEPDDTAATAKYITVTSTVQSQNHTLHTDYDYDWYYFYGIPGRTYTFYASSTSMDNSIYIYQDNGTTQLAWDDDSGAGMNFYLDFAPTVAANYRIKVKCYYMNAGAYTIFYKTSATPDSYEIDDTVAYAQELYPTPALLNQNHTIHNATDVDWYKFMAYTGRIYTFYSSGNLDDRIWLYQADGVTIIDSDDDDGVDNNFYLQFTPTANTYYYLKVDPYPGNAGAYIFSYSYGANPDSYEPDGGSNDYTSFDAYTLYANYQIHTLSTIIDQDWYLCLALVGVQYHFWSTGNEDTQIYIYNANTMVQLAWDDDSGEGNNYDVSYTASSTIQIRIKVIGYGNAVGAYDFHYRHDKDPDSYEDDDTPAQAKAITVTQTDTTQQHNYDTWVDQDWYRFQACKGLLYTFYSSDGQYHDFAVDTKVYLYQDDGTTLLAWDDDSGDASHFYLQFAPVTTGYYKLQSYAYSGGVESYAFHCYYTVLSDAYEPDNSATAYTSLTPAVTAQTQEHTLNTIVDQDWYRFQATAGRLYTFTSYGTMDNQVYLYNDAATTLLATDDDSGDGNNFSLAWNCTSSGYYKVKVIGYSGAIGYYLMSYVFGAVPDSYEPDNSTSDYTDLTMTAYQGIQNHTLHNGADEDWFRFQGIPGKRYTFYSTGDTDTQIYLFADNGTTLLGWDDDNGDGTNFNLQWVFTTTGYYKLKIIGYAGLSAGSYDFYHIFGAQPDAYEPDDSATNYTSLTVTSTLQTQSHTIDDATDQDWFRFQGVAGRTYTFYSTGNTDLIAYLYQESGTALISSDDDSGDGFNFNLQFVPTTTAYYKLKVVPFTNDAGAYGFYYRYTPLGSPANVAIIKSGTSVIVSWNVVTGATSYKLYSSANPYTGFTLLGSTTSNTVTIASPPVKRFYRVTANN